MSNTDRMINDCTTTSSKDPEQGTEETIDCPLFMDGLPKDFQSNPHLAAIASLLDDEETSTTDDKKTPHDFHTNPPPPSKSRGREARAKSRSLRRIAISSPYQPAVATKPSTDKAPSLGEAQLFLNMWKLS